MIPGVHRDPKILIAATLAALALAAVAPAAARASTLSRAEEQQLLVYASHPAQSNLKSMPGMTPEAYKKVLDYVTSGKKISSAEEFKKISGLSDAQFDRLAGVFRTGKTHVDELAAPGAESGAAADTRDNKPDSASRKEALGEPKAPKPTNPALGLSLEVKNAYYSVLPGYDLSKVPDDKRRLFLDAINREMCTCGCTGETLGFCIVNDPGCPVVKARVKKIYRDIVGSDPVPPAATPDKPPNP